MTLGRNKWCISFAVLLLLSMMSDLSPIEAQAKAWAGGGDASRLTEVNIEPYKASLGFSLELQGSHWFYERLSGGDYSSLSSIYLPWNSWRHGTTSLAIGNNWQAPNESGDAVRTWTAPQRGEILIDADGPITIQNNGVGADGVRVKILLNNAQIWPVNGWATILYGTPVAPPPLTTEVRKGDKVRFVVNMNSNSWYDTTTWDPVIEYMPDPKPDLSGMGHIVYATHNWYGIDYQATIKLMDSLGVERWRNWMHTRWLLNSPSTLNLTRALQMKSYIAEAESYGIEVIGMNHNWFNGISDASAVPARDLTPNSVYMQFLQNWATSWHTLVSYFSEITYWEIGNEWDNDVFLHPMNYNNGTHVYTADQKAGIALDMMYYASQAIHNANPGAITIMGGISTVDGFEAMRDFLELMYQKIDSGLWPSADPDDYFEILAWHPYLHAEPDAEWVAENDLTYDIAVQHGDSGKKVFLTEFGFSDWGDPDLDIQTGEWIEQAYELAHSEMDYVETMFLFRLMDETQSNWGGDIEKHFGLFTEPVNGFHAKARAYHYQNFAGGTGNLTEFDNGNYAATYKASSGFTLERQGPRWYYERLSGGVYSPLSGIHSPWSSWRYGTTSLALGNNWQAPNESGDAVRTWLAPHDGEITIRAEGSIDVQNNGTMADGVRVKILLNNSQIWPANGWSPVVCGTPVTPPSVTLDVKEGDLVRFIVNMNANSWYDTTTWNPLIVYTP